MGDKKQFKRALIGAACTLAFAVAGSAQAANWLMLQGTEPEAAAARAEVWGFIQGKYEKDMSNPNAAKGYNPAKLLGPSLNAQDGFDINRARIGVRGTGFPIDSHINYFFMAEMGDNGINYTNSGTTFAKLTDASMTFNYIPGARVRAGLFKTPGAEELLQAIHVMDYINFSEATNQLLLERFPNKRFTCMATNNYPNSGLPVYAGEAPLTSCQGAGSVTTSTGNIPNAYWTEAQLRAGALMNAFNAPIGSGRDTGIQLFDAFDMGNSWELSYAGMIGNGNGITFDNSDGEYEKYGYLSLEKKFGGKGPTAEGLKFFAWGQTGKRLLDITDNSSNDPQLYKRERTGLGLKYLKKPYRFTAEYIAANGMIFVGQDKPNFYLTTVADGNGADAKSSGWYVEGGWYVPNTKWELDARYDILNMLKGRKNQFYFQKVDLGVQYHFNPKTRVTVNYEIRKFNCDSGIYGVGGSPAVGTGCSIVNYNLDGVGNKVGVQVTAVF